MHFGAYFYRVEIRQWLAQHTLIMAKSLAALAALISSQAAVCLMMKDIIFARRVVDDMA